MSRRIGLHRDEQRTRAGQSQLHLKTGETLDIQTNLVLYCTRPVCVLFCRGVLGKPAQAKFIHTRPPITVSQSHLSGSAAMLQRGKDSPSSYSLVKGRSFVHPVQGNWLELLCHRRWTRPQHAKPHYACYKGNEWQREEPPVAGGRYVWPVLDGIGQHVPHPHNVSEQSSNHCARSVSKTGVTAVSGSTKGCCNSSVDTGAFQVRRFLRGAMCSGLRLTAVLYSKSRRALSGCPRFTNATAKRKYSSIDGNGSRCIEILGKKSGAS